MPTPAAPIAGNYACLDPTCRHLNRRPAPLPDGAVCDECDTSLHGDHPDNEGRPENLPLPPHADDRGDQ
jgi:hypothetical protein